MTITHFNGQYYFLSNFHTSPFNWQGVLWPTVEHAFQAAKTFDERVKTRIRNTTTAGEAKSMGNDKQLTKLRPDWDKVKVRIMLDLVRAKFVQSEYLTRKLLATGDTGLVEGNHWGDDYWGMVEKDGELWGSNKLGEILMTVREELRIHILGQESV